jgi:molecular chaperone GrpE (heat shock protein)
MYVRRTIVAIAAAASCSVALAQSAVNQRPAPAQAVAQAQAQAQAQATAAMDQMLPMFEKMMEAMINAQARAAAKPEVAEGAAAFKRNLYDALRKKGFTAAEALQITVATPLPAAPVNSK